MRPAPPSAALIALLPEDAREAVEERAAILEYDGELPRDEAEKRALDWFHEQQKRRP